MVDFKTASGVTLTNANREWETRAPDERFSSIADMHKVAMDQKIRARVAKITAGALRVAANGEEIALTNGTKVAKLTHWSADQLAARAGAPAEYMRSLPTSLAVQCLQHGLDKRVEDGKDAQALMYEGDAGITCRAFTSGAYSRIWNSDLTARLLELEATGPWTPAPAAFDGSRGLYLSDRDMFAFLVDNERRIFERGPGGGLSRGFFIGNSEVGARKFFIMSFMYEFVCGNHRVWGAQEIEEVSVIHIGKDQSAKAMASLQVELKKYAQASSADDEAKVESARRFIVGGNKDEIVDAIMKLKFPGLGKKTVELSCDKAESRVDWYGNPRSAWGIAGGMTEIARDMRNADDRHHLDRAAAKVMEMAW